MALKICTHLNNLPIQIGRILESSRLEQDRSEEKYIQLTIAW